MKRCMAFFCIASEPIRGVRSPHRGATDAERMRVFEDVGGLFDERRSDEHTTRN